MTPLLKIEALGVLAIVIFSMTDANTGSLITMIGVVLTALISAVAAFYAKRAETKAQEAKEKSQEARDKAQEAKDTALATHSAVDGRITAFLEMAKKSFHAEGIAQEQSDERGRKAATDAGVLKEKEAAQIRKT